MYHLDCTELYGLKWNGMEYIFQWNKTSFDVLNLYPSIPIDEAVAGIIGISNNDIHENERNWMNCWIETEVIQ